MNEKTVAALNDIEKYLADPDRLGITSASDLKGLEKYYASSMVLFSLLNRVIDLAQEVVISQKLGMPGSSTGGSPGNHAGNARHSQRIYIFQDP